MGEYSHMYRIALCDDIPSELDTIKEMLTVYSNRNEMRFNIERFDDAAELLDSIFTKKYIPDLLIVDIYLKEMSVSNAVARLREMGYDIPIVFLTMSTEYAFEAYKLDVLQYLVKPLSQEKFHHALDISFGYIGKNRKDKIVIKMTEGVYGVDIDDIVYCETSKNYQILFLENGECKTRMTSSELYDVLKEFPQFIKCGSSYILNMNHVIKVKKEEVYMGNGSKIYLPRNKVSGFTDAYCEYFCHIG